MNLIGRQLLNVLRQNVRNVNNSTFNSYISLKRLYPGSNVNLFTPQFQKESEKGFSGFIPVDQLQITFSRSGGPGGQNVNKVNTKVDVRFHVETANWINNDLKKKIFLEHKTKINKDGFLVVRSEKTRSQQLNLADALERIRTMIWQLTESETVISPETEQRIIRQKEKADRIRLAEKRTRSRIKQDRQLSVVDM
ncbi:hypothetical protein R5R35_009081 [Gryllus longicercus]|uniref:Large ribosomal subunit protein mL62 n=1 Tax=Gryllus longicercus TaxID=2509291 RepID=A0AAN9W1N2_9ORTH